MESLDANSLVTNDRNRWSDIGQPTIYLASAPGVALAEYGRHWSEHDSPISIWAVAFGLVAPLDIRQPDIRSALDLPTDPAWCLDPDRCRAIASDARAMGSIDGLIVPSVAILDDPSAWNAVIFVDRLHRSLTEVVVVRGRHCDLSMAPAAAHRDDRVEAV
jgi:RES domain-containing protein